MRYATQTLKLTRFAVIDDRTAYGQGLADAFTNTIRAAKAQVVKREFTNDKAVDFRNILTSIRRERPEAIFFGGYDAQAGPMAKQMKELGLNIPLLGGETMNTAKFLQLAGDAAEGYVAAGYDYFDGNRHGAHPSYDLFIHDRNQDSLDDRSGQPVTVVAMTGGVVVAAESAWDATSRLRGGNYPWIYAPAEQRLFYYAHNRELLVKVGDRVEPGTPIATVGRSGFNAAKRRSPTHLHLTVLQLRNGRPAAENILPRLSSLTPGR